MIKVDILQGRGLRCANYSKLIILFASLNLALIYIYETIRDYIPTISYIVEMCIRPQLLTGLLHIH